MWNIFKNKESEVLERSNTILQNPKNYPKEVLEIHHEFEIASDKLLENAYKIINSQPVVNISKIERLKSFGFNQVKEVQESSQIIETTKLSQEQIELVQYYKQHYPFNKFITEPQVKEICHKYNLVCGDVGRFRGFVPENNVKDIEKFKLKSKDDNSPKLGECYVIMDDWSLLNMKDVEKYGYKVYGNDLNWVMKDYLPTHGYCFSGNQASSPKTNIPGWGKSFHYRLNNINDSDIKTAINRNKQSFQICAPVKDMDISGLELKEGYKLQKKLEIPDPVVLQPVKDGYLIVTAWGDEASDPLVVNENFN